MIVYKVKKTPEFFKMAEDKQTIINDVEGIPFQAD
jgi:hypothetical protein